MTPRQIELVQASWDSVEPIAEAAAEIFYSKLFALDPALRPLFKGDLAEQGRKLMSMIGLVVRGLTRLEMLLAGVQALGRRHAGYGVRDRHYESVATALLWTLHQGLGKGFTDEVREAWASAYGLLATTMKDAAKVAA